VRSLAKYNLVQVQPSFVAELRRSDNAAFERAASGNHRGNDSHFMDQLDNECSALGF
jgi:hypothetical protein